MPTTDDYGQGISIASLTDAPDADKLATDIVNAIAQRSAMRFSSSSARGATLTSPVEGMVSWLQDVNRLEVYDGAGWITIAAGTTGWVNVPVTTADGWSTFADSDNNNHQGTWQYRVVYMFGQQTIMFRGGIGRIFPVSYTPPGSGYYQLTSTPLPTDARPTQLRTLVVPCSDINSDRITLKLDVRTDGHLRLYGVISGSTPPWVGFNGVSTAL